MGIEAGHLPRDRGNHRGDGRGGGARPGHRRLHPRGPIGRARGDRHDHEPSLVRDAVLTVAVGSRPDRAARVRAGSHRRRVRFRSGSRRLVLHAWTVLLRRQPGSGRRPDDGPGRAVARLRAHRCGRRRAVHRLHLSGGRPRLRFRTRPRREARDRWRVAFAGACARARGRPPTTPSIVIAKTSNAAASPRRPRRRECAGSLLRQPGGANRCSAVGERNAPLRGRTACP